MPASTDRSRYAPRPVEVPRPPPFDYYERLRKLETWVILDIGGDKRCSEAARFLGYQRSYFSRWFSEKVGIPYTTWLRKIRIREAQRRIVVANVRITDLAAEVGYSDLGTFERAFKREVGMPPSEYRARVVPDHS